jgi:hypothetical protein
VQSIAVTNVFSADVLDDTTAHGGSQGGDAGSWSQYADPDAEETTGDAATRKRLSLRDIRERDEIVTFCVRALKMTAPQILKFSRVWEHPFYSESDVHRRVRALRLDKKIRHVARQSLHDEMALNLCIKLWSDAARAGVRLSNVKKEFRLGEDSKIRADMHFFLNDREFFVEVQQSALTYIGWKQKLGKYLRYRKRKDVKPFRVLIAMENESNLNTVFRYAREVIGEDEKLTLFLFGWMPDLMSQYDLVREDVWANH